MVKGWARFEVEIAFATKKLADACNQEKKGNQSWGVRNANRVRQRLAELRAASCLEEISHLPPPRRHPLHGDREGQFAVDLVHPFRLIFEPAHDPVPRKPDGGIDLAQVTSILVLEVEDYHGG